MKMKFKIYFMLSSILVIVCSILKNSTFILGLSSLCGVIYSLLVAKNIRISLIFGMIHVTAYGIILLNENIYGGFIYNVLYSLPMLAYGFYKWKIVDNEKNSGIKKLSKTKKTNLVIAMISITIIYAIILNCFNGSNVLYDSLTSVLGYVGIYLLSNKYVEQWNVWIISNCLCLLFWINLSINDISNLPLVVMWFIYLINSIYGYILWNLKIKETEEK